jgi:hypothetical protein
MRKAHRTVCECTLDALDFAMDPGGPAPQHSEHARAARTQHEVDVAGNSLLEIMDISELATVGKDLVVADNTALTLIEGGKLETVQELRIEGNKKLPADAAEGLRVKTPPP